MADRQLVALNEVDIAQKAMGLSMEVWQNVQTMA